MALNGTLHHRKTRRLAAALEIDPCFALGILEALWHLTYSQCPRGDIGRLSNQDIAEELLYSGDPDKLVTALVECGWLDLSTESRLAVHDWQEHAGWGTKRKLQRRQQQFTGTGVVGMYLPPNSPDPDASPDSVVPPGGTMAQPGGTMLCHDTPKTTKPPAEGKGREGEGKGGGCGGEPPAPPQRSLWPVPQQRPSIPPWRIAKVVEDYKDRVVGANNPIEKWDAIFERELGITYAEALEIRSPRAAARGP